MPTSAEASCLSLQPDARICLSGRYRYAYPCAEWHNHSRLADFISDYRAAFSTVLIGNQIAESALLSEMAVRAVLQLGMRGGARLWRAAPGTGRQPADA